MDLVPMNAEPQILTDDAILNGRLRLLQPKRGHRFGHDAILLAAATPAAKSQRIVELGAGIGAASLALLARVPGIDVTLVEIEATLAALATQNIARNGFAAQARSVTLDVGAPDPDFIAAGLTPATFDIVLMNPPFNDERLQASPDPARRRAHHAAPDTLRLWLDRAARLLRPHGTVSLIWRAEDQDRVLDTLAGDFGAAKILPVHPAPEQAPIRILVNAIRGETAPPSILPGLTLTDRDRRPSREAEACLRENAAIAVSGMTEKPG